MSERILRKRKVVVISSEVIQGVAERGIIHNVQSFTSYDGHEIHVSADELTYESTVEKMEEHLGVKFEEVDHFIVHFQNGCVDVMKKFEAAGIPGHKLTYAVYNKHFEEAEELAELHHPKAFVIGIDYSADPAIGQIIRRFITHSSDGSTTHLTRAF